MPYYRQKVSGTPYISPGGVTFVTNEDGSITMNGTNTSSANADREYVFINNREIWLPVGTYTMSTGTEPITDSSWYLGVDMFSGKINDGGMEAVRGGSLTFAVTEPGYAFATLRVNANKTVNNVTVYPQLEVGSVATGYEKPVETKTLSISTPNSLPGIPVTSGGNYTDENGQQWICDEVDFEKGVYVQRVKTLTLNGSEAWASYNNNLFGVKITEALAEQQVLCNRYAKSRNANYYGTNLTCALDKYRNFWIVNDRYSNDVNALKADLAVNSLSVVYILETPIPNNLSADQLAGYTDLHSNYPNTTVFNDAGAYMEVKYYTPTTAVPMIHSPKDEGKILTIDEHGCVTLKEETKTTLSSLGVTASAAELNYVDGVTSNIQTQLNAKVSTSILPNNSGEIKTKYRIANKGNAGTATRYYKLCTFPANDDYNYASAIISGRIGGWTSGNMSYINALVWNRDTPGISLIDITGSASATSAIWEKANLVLYVNSDNTATLYIQCKSHFTYDLDVEVFQSTANIVYDGTYITTTPTGTLADAASSSTKRMELVNGKIQVNGKDLAFASQIPTVDSSLSSTSTNPIQNKAVYAAINSLRDEFANGSW